MKIELNPEGLVQPLASELRVVVTTPKDLPQNISDTPEVWVIDQRTGRTFTVGIVINKFTGDTNSMGENSFMGFLQTGDVPRSGDNSNLNVN
jgi:hypothetical protein